MTRFFTAFLILTVLISALPVCVLGQEDHPGQAYFQEGIRLREAKKYTQGAAALRRALEKEPVNSDYHLELANIYAAHYDAFGKYKTHSKAKELLDLAAHSLENVIMLRPDDVAGHYNLGVVYKRQGEYEKAREQFKKVLEKEPDAPHAWMQIGATYEEQGFFDDAKDAYLEAREKDYMNPEIRDAIDDLKDLREEDRQRMEARQVADQRLAYLQGFRFSPYSHADEYSRRSPSQGAAAVAAVPFVASMLVEQFMNRKADKKVDL